MDRRRSSPAALTMATPPAISPLNKPHITHREAARRRRPPSTRGVQVMASKCRDRSSTPKRRPKRTFRIEHPRRVTAQRTGQQLACLALRQPSQPAGTGCRPGRLLCFEAERRRLFGRGRGPCRHSQPLRYCAGRGEHVEVGWRFRWRPALGRTPRRYRAQHHFHAPDATGKQARLIGAVGNEFKQTVDMENSFRFTSLGAASTP